MGVNCSLYRVPPSPMKELESEYFMRTTFGRDELSVEEAEESAAADKEFDRGLLRLLEGIPASNQLDLDKLWDGLQFVLGEVCPELGRVVRGDEFPGIKLDFEVGLLGVRRVEQLGKQLVDLPTRTQLLDKVGQFDPARIVDARPYAWEAWQRGPVDLAAVASRLFSFVLVTAEEGAGIVCTVR